MNVHLCARCFARRSFVSSPDHGSKTTVSDFPLPTSASQDQIAAMLSSGAPAVVVEGPPGCGEEGFGDEQEQLGLGRFER